MMSICFLKLKQNVTNDTACFFEDIDECFEYFEKKTYRIVKNVNNW